MDRTLTEVSVVGAGTMGHGIAVAFAGSGRSISLFDINEKQLARARRNIRSALQTLDEAGHLPNHRVSDIEKEIDYYTTLSDAVEGVDFVTEAGPEDLETKQQIFTEIDTATSDDAIITTNTSGLSVTDIGSVVDAPDRTAGTHWFTPPYIVPVVEVIKGEQTSESTLEDIQELLVDIGKTPALVQKDIPGFIANRLQVAMVYEAFSLLERGVASPQDIDRIAKGTFGLRLPVSGIFEKADLSGLDLARDVNDYLVKELDRGTETHAVLDELVENGNMGVKTGAGFYDWGDRDAEDLYRSHDEGLLSLLNSTAVDEWLDGLAPKQQ